MISLLHDQNWNTPFSGALCSGGSRPWGKGGGGRVSVCLSHVGLGFRPKLGEEGLAPSLNPPLLCKHMCPRTTLWLFFCCCVVPVSCFVTVLFDSCVAVQSCRGKSHMSIFFVFSCHIYGNTVVLRSRNFATMATWHNGLSSLLPFCSIIIAGWF